MTAQQVHTMLDVECVPASGRLSLTLEYRSPYAFADLLGFFEDRALAGVEAVEAVEAARATEAEKRSYIRVVRLFSAAGNVCTGWLRVEDDAEKNRLVVTLSDTLAPVAAEIAERVRHMFDVDCDPDVVAAALRPLRSAMPSLRAEGVRLPGCFDPFETACRAVLGQQVSVKAANRLAARIVEAHGPRVDVGLGGGLGGGPSVGLGVGQGVGLDVGPRGLGRVWPAPADLLALGSLEEALGVLGVIRSRSRTIGEIARLLESGELDLRPGAPVDEQMRRLLSIKGVGPWTAQYIAMRTMGHTDAFLETDAGVAHALPGMTPIERLAAVQSCKPRRSYAVVALWNTLVRG